jgi:hypothetical protein
MANAVAGPIGLESSLTELTTRAFQSTIKLYRVVQGFQNRPKPVRDLEEELEALCTAQEALAETVRATDDVDFSTLKLLLLRCSEACEEFRKEITKWSSRVRDRQSFRDRTKLRYMGNDMDDFRQLLAAYKSTIIIALTDANL